MNLDLPRSTVLGLHFAVLMVLRLARCKAVAKRKMWPYVADVEVATFRPQ